MALPIISGEFGVGSIEAKFTQAGKLWVRMRVVAKDSKRDPQTGQWVDGNQCWITALAWSTVAENLAESVEKGDSVVLTGKLAMNEWTTEAGEKKTDYQIHVDSAGVGVRFHPAKPMKGERKPQSSMAESKEPSSSHQQSDEPPW